MTSIEKYKRKLLQLSSVVVLGSLLSLGVNALISDACDGYYDDCNSADFILLIPLTILYLLTAIVAFLLVLYFFGKGFSLRRQFTKVFHGLYWFSLAILIVLIAYSIIPDYDIKSDISNKAKIVPAKIFTKTMPTIPPDPNTPAD